MKSIILAIFLSFVAYASEPLRKYLIPVIVVIALWHILLFIAKRGGDKLPKLHCYLFSGSMGSGKSYSAVECARSTWFSRRLHNVIYKLFFWVEKLPFKYLKHIFPEEWKYGSEVYSTYPIALRWKRLKLKERFSRRRKYPKEIKALKVRLQKEELTEAERVEITHRMKFLRMTMRRDPVFCKPLLAEHLMGEEKLPENAVIVIGEAGRVLPQWDFDNPIVVEQIAHFVALSRQFVNAVIILDDQCSDNVVKAVRCRLGMIYHLHNFRRLWGIFPYYKVDYTELLPVEDNKLTTKEVEGETFFIGKLPYPWTPFSKFYESRMYKELYYFPAVERVEEFTSFYTRYLPNIAVNEALCKYYRNNKRAYKRNFLYNPEMRFDIDKGEFVAVPRGGGDEGEGVQPPPPSSTPEDGTGNERKEPQ